LLDPGHGRHAKRSRQNGRTGTLDSTGTGTNSLFVVRNTIGRNIACGWIDPGVFGYGNSIAGHALGQCEPLTAS